MAKGRSPIVWCALSAALFGASTPASKALLEQLSPWFLAGLLYAGAAVAVAPWALRERRRWRSIDRRSWLRLLGAVGFGGVLGPVLLMFGLSLAPAGSVALWLNLETVATALLARWFFKEHLHAPTWIAVGLVVAASALLSPGTLNGGVAAVLVACACVSWGLDNNLTAVLDRFSPAEVTFAKGVGAGALNIALGLALESPSFEAPDIGLALGLGAVSYGISLLLYIAGAQQLGATRSQLIFSTAPIWGLVFAWTALSEPMEWQQLLAAGIMTTAIWLFYGERHEHEHTHEAVTHRHWHRHDDGHHDHDHPQGDTWHSHEHTHEPVTHSHRHRPDLHHRHGH
jgi:drug/metabolite transporter (DMT)-like permease